MRVEPNAKDMARAGVAPQSRPANRHGGCGTGANRKKFSPNADGRKLNSLFGHEVEPRLETGMNRVAN